MVKFTSLLLHVMSLHHLCYLGTFKKNFFFSKSLNSACANEFGYSVVSEYRAEI